MPRHWHPVKFASIKVINVSYDGKMDSSVKHWNNTKGATRMTSSATYLDHKRRILKRKASRKSYAKSSIYGIYGNVQKSVSKRIFSSTQFLTYQEKRYQVEI